MTKALIEEGKEKLPTPEEKDLNLESYTEPQSGFDYQRIKGVIDKRRKKLERIKDLISRKLYFILSEKIDNEELTLKNKAKEKAAEKEKINKPQSLPKAFFEKKSLKPKSIRID